MNLSGWRIFLKSAWALSTNSDDRYRSIAEAARVFAATIIPFSPILLPVQATICQLWPGAPNVYDATLNLPTGTSQLISPVSVEARLCPSLSGSGSMPSDRGLLNSPSNGACVWRAKAFSSYEN